MRTTARLSRGRRWLDTRIANPAYGVVLVSGVAMVLTGGYQFGQGWIATAIVLYVLTAVFGIVAFAPAVRLQRAEAADPTSAAYARIARRTRWYSWLTTGVIVVIIILMVTKPF